jgi:hypothetical protein
VYIPPAYNLFSEPPSSFLTELEDPDAPKENLMQDLANFDLSSNK